MRRLIGQGRASPARSMSEAEFLSHLAIRSKMIELLEPMRVTRVEVRDAIYRLAFEFRDLSLGGTPQAGTAVRALAERGFDAYFGPSSKPMLFWQVGGAQLKKLFPLLESRYGSRELPRRAFQHWMRVLEDEKLNDLHSRQRGARDWHEAIEAFGRIEDSLTANQALERWTTVAGNLELIPEGEVFRQFKVSITHTIAALRSRGSGTENQRALSALEEIAARMGRFVLHGNPLHIRPLKMISKYEGEEQGIWTTTSVVTDRFLMRPVYLRTPEERRPFRVSIDRNGRVVDSEGRVVNAPDGEVRAIYGFDTKGQMYLNLSPVRGAFHHSSFVAGGEVLCAGEIVIVNGVVRMIDNNSGHYLPSSLHLQTVVEFMRGQGAQIPDTAVEFYAERSRPMLGDQL